jgi:O-acetyl-ADP-ribose deacetylase (regulator of RNase III)
MLVYLYSSLFESPAQTLVNTVNTEGVMGKGIAKRFKSEYPAMFKEYKKLCDAGELVIGKLQLWKGAEHWVINFPTKTTWRKPSSLDYLVAGLETFRAVYQQIGITSVAFPPLGCGNGELEWKEVRPVMEHYLENLSIPVYIHNMHFGPEFVPEHCEPPAARPTDFDTFLLNVAGAIYRNRGQFSTLDKKSEFSASMDDESNIHITTEGGRRTIPAEELERAWIGLRDGILSIYLYGDESSRRYKSYLFPILASLPYVRQAPMQKAGSTASAPAVGLFFDRRGYPGLETAEAKRPEQQWLFH